MGSIELGQIKRIGRFQRKRDRIVTSDSGNELTQSYGGDLCSGSPLAAWSEVSIGRVWRGGRVSLLACSRYYCQYSPLLESLKMPDQKPFKSNHICRFSDSLARSLAL